LTKNNIGLPHVQCKIWLLSKTCLQNYNINDSSPGMWTWHLFFKKVPRR